MKLFWQLSIHLCIPNYQGEYVKFALSTLYL